jgi:cbb3-type cytochrome oxidase subunit 3
MEQEDLLTIVIGILFLTIVIFLFYIVWWSMYSKYKLQIEEDNMKILKLKTNYENNN